MLALLLRHKIVLILILAAILGVSGWLLLDRSVIDHPQERIAAGFQECAPQVGITWRMRFLPSEQGESFKINLYDHGCGVAVGDFDGDGHEDVYFCNQLGRNALYRNKGDGSFADVTEKAGVQLGAHSQPAVFFDYNNDGLLDLFVTNTAKWTQPAKAPTGRYF